jgi:hypothetical protein
MPNSPLDASTLSLRASGAAFLAFDSVMLEGNRAVGNKGQHDGRSARSQNAGHPKDLVRVMIRNPGEPDTQAKRRLTVSCRR